MTVKYEIVFFSFWHCSSGKSPYDDRRMLVVKDVQGFPYVPGKTIKGLLKENLINLVKWKYNIRKAYSDWINYNFGNEMKTEVTRYVGYEGLMHVGDAALDVVEKQFVASEFAQHLLFCESKHRKLEKPQKEFVYEVTIPCRLIGTIDVSLAGLTEKETRLFIQEGLGLTKRIGMFRNNGLGRCHIRVVENF